MKAELKNNGAQSSPKATRCWEFKKCKKTRCPVYLTDRGAICYYMSGSHVGDASQSINSKIENCKKCDFYQYNEKHSLEFKEKVLGRLKKLEDELQSLFKVSPEEKAVVFKQRAEYLSKQITYKEPEEKMRLLTFRLGSEKYCIRIQHTLEILHTSDINKLPCTPPHFVGVINLRGAILTLIDLKEFLGIEKDSEENAGNFSATIIVVEIDGETAGILVDKVEDILDIGINQITPPLTTLKGIKEEFTEGGVLIEGIPLTLLNVEKMMRDERMRVFEMVNPNL